MDQAIDEELLEFIDPAQGIDAGLGGLMATLLGRRRGLDATASAALAAALDDPIFELLPLKNLPEQIPHLPAGARVSVTASPAKGIDATLDWAVRLQADGYRAIPHLSARMIPDRATLAGLLDRAREGGLTTRSSWVAMRTSLVNISMDSRFSSDGRARPSVHDARLPRPIRRGTPISPTRRSSGAP